MVDKNMEKYDYEIVCNADGTKILRRYNKKFEVWVNLEFNNETSDSMQIVLETLKNTYIQKKQDFQIVNNET